MSTSREQPRVSSGTLIINNAESARPILETIAKFQRVFSLHPISVLRKEEPSHVNIIKGLARRFEITTVPVLITQSGDKFVGNKRICEFIPILAHALVSAVSAPARPNAALHPSAACSSGEIFEQYQLRASDEMDRSHCDDDEAQDSEEAQARMEKYKRDMQERHAHILAAGEEERERNPTRAGTRARGAPAQGARVPARAPAKALQDAARDVPRVDDDDEVIDDVPRRKPLVPPQKPIPTAAPRPASQAAAQKGGDDAFERRFFEMTEETPGFS